MAFVGAVQTDERGVAGQIPAFLPQQGFEELVLKVGRGDDCVRAFGIQPFFYLFPVPSMIQVGLTRCFARELSQPALADVLQEEFKGKLA